ncbi:hypothetical protein [Oxalobacter formigenes]|uniref:hypothetical protein n=1 Tax=Oxalobacter formigenes TaxID=847 RepID=UPI00241D7983|nr:hypothetical protein [Oxalobacter formigenes]
MSGQLDEAEKQILGTLLADFTDRDLSAKELKSGYEGPQITAITTAVCNNEDVTKVDFDVAFSDLEKKKFVRTGPMKAYENRPGDFAIIIGSYSKREYAYLTEDGYKAARKAPNRPQRIQRVVNNVHISGGQFNNLQLATGENVQQTMENKDTNSEVIAKLISILEKQGQTVTAELYSDLESIVSEANQGNGKQAKSLLAKVCGPMWETLQPIIWPIVGELVKRSLEL